MFSLRSDEPLACVPADPGCEGFLRRRTFGSDQNFS